VAGSAGSEAGFIDRVGARVSARRVMEPGCAVGGGAEREAGPGAVSPRRRRTSARASGKIRTRSLVALLRPWHHYTTADPAPSGAAQRVASESGFGTVVARYRRDGCDYHARAGPGANIAVERVPTGVRLVKRLLEVPKVARAEYKEVTLGDLLEGVVQHAVEGKPRFSTDRLQAIERLRQIQGQELDASSNHRMADRKRA